MPAPKKIDGRMLRKAFRQDLASAWETARRKHTDQTPYAFVLYGVEGAPSLTAVVLTEESLAAAAGKYVKNGYYEAIDEARDDLRWSVEDSPNYNELFDAMPSVDALVEPWSPHADETEGYKRLSEVAIKAFQDLDKQGVFGEGASREALILAVTTPVAEVDLTLPTAKKLNSAAAYARLEAANAVEGEYQSCEAMAFSADGGSVGFAGGRHPENDEDRALSGLVSAEVTGVRATRRWAFEFPMFGDSFSSVAWDAASSTFLALRRTYQGNGCLATLMRFDPSNPQPIAEQAVEGEPAGFGVAPDGTRIVLCCQKRRVVVFDEGLNVLAEHAVSMRVHQPMLLRSRECLAATDDGVARLDLVSGELEVVIGNEPAFQLTADEGEQTLVVSRWFNTGQRQVGKDTPFGVHVYDLPSLRLRHTLEVDDRQCVAHALSSDGRLVAFETSATGTAHKHTHVFDSQSGQEIARKRTKTYLAGEAFVPGTQTLAIGVSDYREHEPIDFWKISSGQEPGH